MGSITEDRVFTVAPSSKAELELLAKEILLKFDPEISAVVKPLNLKLFAEIFVEDTFGWSLDVQEKLSNNILGYCDPKSKTFVIPEETYNQLDFDGRSRFTTAHECAHVIKHGTQMVNRMVSMSESGDQLHRKSRVEIKPYIDPEWQANYLAGCLLMPRWHVLKIFYENKSIESTILEICRKFLVSKKAAEIRLKYVMQK